MKPKRPYKFKSPESRQRIVDAAKAARAKDTHVLVPKMLEGQRKAHERNQALLEAARVVLYPENEKTPNP